MWIEAAFVSSGDRTITTQKVLETIEETKSISVTLKDKIEEMNKAFERFDFKQANKSIKNDTRENKTEEHDSDREQEPSTDKKDVLKEVLDELKNKVEGIESDLDWLTLTKSKRTC